MLNYRRYLLHEQEDEERKMILAVMGNNACMCPACGFIIEKLSGDDTMMCGCEVISCTVM
jgi:hypothetical protein